MLVSSVPLSETRLSGAPRRPMMASNSRTTRLPESEVSGTRSLYGCPPMMLGAEIIGPRFNTINLRDSRPPGYAGCQAHYGI